MMKYIYYFNILDCENYENKFGKLPCACSDVKVFIFFKTIVWLRKRQRKIENLTIVFYKFVFFKMVVFKTIVVSLTIVNDNR